MKKLLCLMILGLFVISMISVVSAMVVPPKNVIVGGTIFNKDYSVVSGTEVKVECNTFSQTVTTSSEGEYGVEFDGSETPCFVGDIVTVTATEYGVSKTDDVTDFPLTVNLVIINVTVPEFGLIMGALTLMGCIGIFFFVRK